MEISKLDLVNNKIVELIELKRVVARWQLKREKVVFTNGVFDIIHKGHVGYLLRAADQGNRLIVALNSDESVKSLNKGTTRPLQDEGSRALALAAMTYVDAVVVFNEHTPENLIAELLPDVLVKGGDYKIEEIVGYKQVQANGGEVLTIPLTDGYSTTNIEQKIKSA